MIDARLTCDGDILTSVSIDKGFQERPLWKRMERLRPQEMIYWIDRFDSLCPIAGEWALAQALEKSMGLQVTKKAQVVRSLLCEINRLVWLTTYLGRVTDVLGQKTITQQILVLRERVFVIQEELTGGRILPQAFTVGGCRRGFTMGDVQKVRQFFLAWKSVWESWLSLVVDDPLLEARLKSLVILSPNLIEKLGWWGVVGKASGIDYDSRKHRPHGAYIDVDFNVPSRKTGDALARFHVAIDEINLALFLLDKFLSQGPQETMKKDQEPTLTPGFFFGCAESAKGPVVAAVEVGAENVVTSLRLFSTGQRVWPVVDHFFHDIRAEDFQLAFASLGVDSEESEI